MQEDPRLDTRYWHVFGRRVPRRFSVYARVVAGIMLVLFLGWWFTRDVTYVSNVKVSGLDATRVEYREPLREYAEDLAAVVNQLADSGFSWRSGSLPAFRTADALSDEERREVLALGTVEVKGDGDGGRSGPRSPGIADFLEGRGWAVTTGPDGRLANAEKRAGPLTAVLHVEEQGSFELMEIRVWAGTEPR